MLSLQSDPRQQQQQQLISRVSHDGVVGGDPRVDSSFPFYSDSGLPSVNINSELSREGSPLAFCAIRVYYQADHIVAHSLGKLRTLSLGDESYGNEDAELNVWAH
ncbi:hypothetical protein FXO37_05427 [Capsicum annuum]|nr:hypothetical protein FXO37_05427 [Capsicum annuum]